MSYVLYVFSKNQIQTVQMSMSMFHVDSKSSSRLIRFPSPRQILYCSLLLQAMKRKTRLVLSLLPGLVRGFVSEIEAQRERLKSLEQEL